MITEHYTSAPTSPVVHDQTSQTVLVGNHLNASTNARFNRLKPSTTLFHSERYTAPVTMREVDSSSTNYSFVLRKLVWNTLSCSTIQDASTPSLIEARRAFVHTKQNRLPGGPYHPHCPTLSELKIWLADIRRNTENKLLSNDTRAIFPDLEAALGDNPCSGHGFSTHEDWSAAKVFLDTYSTAALKSAVAHAKPIQLINIFSKLFSSVEASAHASSLPNRYRLNDQIFKPNNPGWNPNNIELVKKLIDSLDHRAVTILSETKNYPSAGSVLTQMLKQAEIYTNKRENPHAHDEDRTWIGDEDETTLFDYLSATLEEIKDTANT